MIIVSTPVASCIPWRRMTNTSVVVKSEPLSPPPEHDSEERLSTFPLECDSDIKLHQVRNSLQHPQQTLQDITNNKEHATVKDLVSIIRKGSFEDFLGILKSIPNTNLNTFVNGNTALHHCLIEGGCLERCH